MSVFCSSSTSTSRFLLSKLAPRQPLPFLYPVDIHKNPNHRSHGAYPRTFHSSMVSNATALEAWFINSLANAGHCQRHTPKKPHRRTFFTSRRPNQPVATLQGYAPQTQKKDVTGDKSETANEEPPIIITQTPEQLMELVDQYDGISYSDQLPTSDISGFPRRYPPSDGPNLTISDKPEDEWPPPRQTWPADADTRETLETLETALKNIYTDPDDIHHLYRRLPGPRAPYLEANLRHKMLHRLSVTERKDEHSMLRYLSVIDDMKRSAIPLSTSEWTSALSFVARYVTRSTVVEVEAALHMWREMEHVAGVKGNEVTFNVLYDVACKAGKFSLAEMIYKEMENRGLKHDRYYHVSKIFFHGLQADGDSARAAYKTLVDSGEIVDTIVLNAMISALIRSQESHAAENIYERMKRIHMESSDSRLNPTDWRKRRAASRKLKAMTEMVRLDLRGKKLLQSRTSMSPDLRTFKILIDHFATHAGDLAKTSKLLDEMREFDIPLHGSLFLSLFKTFAMHGGIRYSEWTEQRLESVWKALLLALENPNPDSNIFISQWLVIWMLRAFARCSGRSRTITIWEEIKEKWHPHEAELDFAMSNLRHLLEMPDAALKRHDWMTGIEPGIRGT